MVVPLHTCSSHRLMRSDCGIGSGSSAVADNAAGNEHFAALSRFQFPPHPPTKSTWCHWLDRSGAAHQSLQPVCHFLLLRHTLPPQKPLFCISTSERGRLCFALPPYISAGGDVKQYLIVLELSQEVLQRCRHSRNKYITQWPLFTLEYDI